MMACALVPPLTFQPSRKTSRIEPEPAQERDPEDRNEREAHGPRLERPTTRAPRILAKVKSQITPAVANTLPGGELIHGNELREIAHGRDGDRDVPYPVAEPVDVVGLEAHVGTKEIAGVGVGPALLRLQLSELGEDEAKRHCAGRGHEPAEDGDAADRGEVDRQQEDARCRSCFRPPASWPGAATSSWRDRSWGGPRGPAERQQPRGHLAHDLAHLGIGRMKRGRRVAPAPLHREGDDLPLSADPRSGDCRRSRPTRRPSGRVPPTASPCTSRPRTSSMAAAMCRPIADGLFLVRGRRCTRDIIVVDLAPLAVVGAVPEAHARIPDWLSSLPQLCRIVSP